MGGEMKALHPTATLALLKLEQVCPGWASGWALIRDIPELEKAILALAGAANTPITDLRTLAVPKLIRYLKMIAQLKSDG